LIVHFYQQLLQNQSPAIALHNAQQWLKSVTTNGLIQWIEQLSQDPNLGYHWQKELRQEIQTLKERKGKLDTEQPFAHPFYWAAFALTGRGN
jgi:CHAT domain-containing protein